MCLTAPSPSLSPASRHSGRTTRSAATAERSALRRQAIRSAAATSHRRCAQLRRRASAAPREHVHASPDSGARTFTPRDPSIRTHTPRARDPKGRASRRLRSPHQAMPRLRVPRRARPRERIRCIDFGGTGGTAVARPVALGFCLNRGFSCPAREVCDPDRVKRHEADEPQRVAQDDPDHDVRR